MSDAFRGLTLRLNADDRPLKSAISSITSAASKAQGQINRLSNALKFDPTNVRAMESRLDLMGDKALLTARQSEKISVAMEQAASRTLKFSEYSGMASGKLRDVASVSKNIYADAERIKQAYNHVDTELEAVHDAAIKVARTKLGMTVEQATNHVKKLKEQMSGVGPKADAARKEMEKLVRSAAMTTDIGEKFGLEKVIGSASTLWGIYNRLIDQHNKLQSDLGNVKSVKEFEKYRQQAEALDSELKKICSDAAEMRAEFYSVRGATGLQDAIADAKRFDASLDAARASAQRMTDALRKAPDNFEAARGKAVAFHTQISASQQKLQSLYTVMDKIAASDGFNKQRAELSDVWTAAEKAKSAYADLEVEEAKLVAKLNEFEAKQKDAATAAKTGNEKAKSEAAEYAAEIEKINSKLDVTRSKLKAADGAVKSTAMEKTFRNAREEATLLISEISQLESKMRGFSQYQASFEGVRRVGYGLYSTVTQWGMMAARYITNAADEIDSAYRDMRKTVNGTEEDFEHLRDAALEYSSTHVTSADKILEIESIGGQLGITVDNLEAFGRTVSNLDIATNMDTEDIALDLAKLSNILHFGQEEYDNFADALVRLGNNEPALESDIMKISMRFAGMAANVGMSTQDVLAFATAATATGQKAEAAGSSMQRTISRIGNAVSEGGDALEAYSRISGMTAEEFAATWKDTENHGPARAMQAFVEGLQHIKDNGGDVNLTLGELGINGVRDKQLLSGLTNTTNVLAESLQMADDAYNGMSTTMKDGAIEQAGDAAREAGKKSEGFSGQLAIMKNNLQLLANEAAEGAVPIMKTAAELFQGLSKFVSDMPDGAKTAAVALSGLGIALGPALVGIGAVGSAATGVIDKFRGIGRTHLFKQAAAGSETAAKKLAAVGWEVERLEDGTVRLNRAATAAINTESKSYRWTSESAAAMRKYTGAIERNADSMARNKAKMEAYNGSKSSKKYQRMLANQTKMEENEVALRQKVSKLDSQARRSSMLSGVGSVLKGFGAMAGISIAIAGIEMFAGAVGEAMEKAENYRKATEGMSDVTQRLKTSYNGFDDLLRSHSKGLETSTRSMADVRRGYDETTAANAALVDQMNEELDTAWDSSIRADVLADRILELAGNCDGSATSLSELRSAVSEFNSTTGADLSVVDNYTGAINYQKDAVYELTDAYRELIELRAYEQMYEEAAAAVANTDVEIRKLVEHQQTAIDDQTRLTNEHPVLAKYSENDLLRMQQWSPEAREFLMNKNAIQEDQRKIDSLLDQKAALGEELDLLKEMVKEKQVDVDKTKEAADATRAAARDYNTYWDALNNVGEASSALNELANYAGYAGASAEELQPFTDAMFDAGITAERLASVGTEGFKVLYDNATTAGQGLTEVNDAISVINAIGIDPKAINFTSNGLEVSADIEGLEEQIGNVDGDTVTFTVSDDGTILANGKEIDTLRNKAESLDGNTYSVKMEADVSRAYNAVNNFQTWLSGKTFTIWTNQKKRASGGIVPDNARGALIPRNASGAINGIVNRATLTNIGWVGEAGAEAVMHMRNAGGAVIPLSNRRYVRPFARAVASEMGGNSTVVHNHYSINGMQLTEGSDAADAMVALFGAVKMRERA